MDEKEIFLEEYDEIHEKMQDLYWNLTDKDLKLEVFELISVLEEDYRDRRDECEEAINKEWQDEIDSMNYQFEKDRI